MGRGWKEIIEGAAQREEGDPGAAWREGKSSGGKREEYTRGRFELLNP